MAIQGGNGARSRKRKSHGNPVNTTETYAPPSNCTFDGAGVPFITLYESRDDDKAPRFQLRKGCKPTSDYTEDANNNLIREYDAAVRGNVTDSAHGVLVHYGASNAKISSLRKRLKTNASVKGSRGDENPVYSVTEDADDDPSKDSGPTNETKTSTAKPTPRRIPRELKPHKATTKKKAAQARKPFKNRENN